jgi:predicted dehydrogenase
MIGVGIIGYGYWGPNLSRCVADAEGCFVAAIGDSSPGALAIMLRAHWQADALKDAAADPNGDDKRSPFVFNDPPDEA